jgi:arginyl-tRNA synthetase
VPGLESLLTERLRAAFAAVAGEPVDPIVRRSPRADFQANGALGLAKRLGRDAREVAAEVVAEAEERGLRELVAGVEVAGPGFLNLTLADGALGELATSLVDDDRLGVEPAAEPDVVVVDYSAPNAAKEMHVGHLRSTIIGDAVVRLLEWRGHTVIRQNHIGEWGTPFGMLIEHLLDIGETEAAAELSVGDLNGFYQAARRKFDADEAFQERSRARVVLLQGGDAATLRLWDLLVEQSKQYFLSVYDRLDVRLDADDFAGESIYNDQLAATAEELARLGLLREDDGAQCVFPEGFTGRDGDPLPMIVVKRDGGFGYDTTDLAALRYRTHDLKATRLLYVVGAPQQLHLQMLFEVGREAGWLGDGDGAPRAEHISFGSVLGPDGKILRTRAGASIRLIELLDEAVTRAAAEVAERNPSLEAGEAAEVADAVGIGAVKYADLSTDRNKDYVFDYGRMLSFDGNTAPYLQYAHTRIQSIFRRAEVAPDACTGPIVIAEAAERELAIELLSLADVLAEVERNLELHRLCHHLYGVATAFTSFYEHCPVLRADDEAIRTSRLALCALTARTLSLGLNLIGITTPTRM